MQHRDVPATVVGVKSSSSKASFLPFLPLVLNDKALSDPLDEPLDADFLPLLPLMPMPPMPASAASVYNAIQASHPSSGSAAATRGVVVSSLPSSLPSSSPCRANPNEAANSRSKHASPSPLTTSDCVDASAIEEMTNVCVASPLLSLENELERPLTAVLGENRAPAV